MNHSGPIFIRKDKPSQNYEFLAIMAGTGGVVIISIFPSVTLMVVTGFFLMLTGLSVLTLRSSLYFSTSPAKLVTKWQLLLFRWRGSEELPRIKYLSVVRYKRGQRLNYKSISYDDSVYVYHVNLIFDDKEKRFRTLASLYKRPAILLAKKIAYEINVPVLDATTPRQKWMKW